MNLALESLKQDAQFEMRLISDGDDVVIDGKHHGSFSDGTNWLYGTPEKLALKKTIKHGPHKYRLKKEGAMMTLEAIGWVRAENGLISMFPVDENISFNAIQLTPMSRDILISSISATQK